LNGDDSFRVQCPRCGGALRASAKDAGQRLQCPKCQSTFKVPGNAAASGTPASRSSEDEQWFPLDQSIPQTPSGKSGQRDAVKPTASQSTAAKPAAAKPAAATPAAAKPATATPTAAKPTSARPTASGPATPPGSQVGPQPTARASVPNNPGKRTTAQELPSRAHAGGVAGFTEAERRALQGAGAFDDSQDEIPQAFAPLPEGTGSEYRAKCPVCESIHFVKPSMAGKKTRCGDCLSHFVVPPPPKVVAKPKMDLEKSPTFALSAVEEPKAQSNGPWEKSAAEYLREAENAREEDELPQSYENPDVKKWLEGMFGVFRDPATLVYWFTFGSIGSLPAVAAALMGGDPRFQFFAALLSLLFLSFVVTCAFVILETVASGEREIRAWPTFDPVSWFGQSSFAVAAMIVSAAPGLVFGWLVLGGGIGSIATTMLTVFLFFPYILLSMMDNESILAPISTDVSKSATRCKEAWGTLYFSAMLLFIGCLIAQGVADAFLPDAGSAYVRMLIIVGMIFVYFSMVGQLAFQIGRALNAPAAEKT